MKNTLTLKQERAITAVLAARTVEAGLETAKVSKTTFYGWRKQPDFAAAYQQARKDIVQRAYALLEKHLGTAAETLAELLKSTDERTKLRAAIAIIDLHSKHIEAEEIEQRLVLLEEKILKK